jgi:uncharacterized membrane protein YuzA (DUF378 family)
MLRYLQNIAIGLLLIGGLNWGFIGCLRTNIIERLIGKTIISKILYILIGASSLLLVFNRDTYIPFFGETIFPSSVFQEQTPAGATRSVIVKVKPHTKVVYWASEPGDNLGKKTFDVAYAKYENAGVTTSDNSGFATLKIREPQSYKISFVTLMPHIHYRQVKEPGYLGRIQTKFL